MPRPYDESRYVARFRGSIRPDGLGFVAVFAHSCYYPRGYTRLFIQGDLYGIGHQRRATGRDGGCRLCQPADRARLHPASRWASDDFARHGRLHLQRPRGRRRVWLGSRPPRTRRVHRPPRPGRRLCHALSHLHGQPGFPHERAGERHRRHRHRRARPPAGGLPARSRRAHRNWRRRANPNAGTGLAADGLSAHHAEEVQSALDRQPAHRSHRRTNHQRAG